MSDLFLETPLIVSVFYSEEIFNNEEVLISRIDQILNLNALTVLNIILRRQNENTISN